MNQHVFRPVCHRPLLRSASVLALFAALATSAAAAEDAWPRQFTSPKGNTVVVYQPQAETLKGDTFTGRAAVSVTKKDEPTPKFGVFFFTKTAARPRDE